jgi:hypothetical protein
MNSLMAQPLTPANAPVPRFSQLNPDSGNGVLPVQLMITKPARAARNGAKKMSHLSRLSLSRPSQLSCYICHCSEDRPCILENGEPCSWVTPGLCSNPDCMSALDVDGTLINAGQGDDALDDFAARRELDFDGEEGDEPEHAASRLYQEPMRLWARDVAEAVFKQEEEVFAI